MTATAETQKPEVTKNSESSQEGWPGWGLGCEDQDAKKKCLLKQTSELWAPSLIGNSLRAGLQNKQFARVIWYNAPHQTSSARHLGQWMMTAMNLNAKPAARESNECLLLERCSKHPMVEVGILFSSVWSLGWSKSSTSQIYKVHIIIQPHFKVITHNTGDL